MNEFLWQPQQTIVFAGDSVLRHQPDWVTIKIGINDLHRTLANLPTAVPTAQFETYYREILNRTRKSGAKLILINAFYISNETQPGMQRHEILCLLPEYLRCRGAPEQRV